MVVPLLPVYQHQTATHARPGDPRTAGRSVEGPLSRPRGHGRQKRRARTPVTPSAAGTGAIASCGADGQRGADIKRISAPLVPGFLPRQAGTEGDGQGDGEVGGAAHRLAHERAQVVELTRRDLEQQLVVHLEQHP